VTQAVAFFRQNSSVLRHRVRARRSGLFAFSMAYAATRHDTFSAAMIFLMLSLPMTLLSSALR
jgi:hypothetical protein